jgi:hypothetical protein
MNFKQWLILSETITVKDQEFRDPLNALKHIQATHPNPENLVVTFTAIDKVGINPKSTYDTPLGIYFYPLDYVIEKKMNVEFAGNQPYINVCEFTRPDKILHMTDDVNNQKGLELLNVFPQEEVDVAMQNISNNYMLRSNYSELWLVTREMAENKPVLWNANLRKCGIDGFLDHGTGTIHGNEPTQGVVFTANSLKRILIIPQTLFTKQGNTMPVRKPLPSLDKIPLNQLENLLKTRNLSDNDFHYLLKYAPDRHEMARLIAQHAKELSGDNIKSLLGVVSDIDEMARILGPDNINKLTGNNVYDLLHNALDKEKMARILGKENINKLNGSHVFDFLHYASDQEKMAEILSPDNINKLTGENVSILLRYTFKKEKMAEILGSDNINKLDDQHVNQILNSAPNKNEMINIIIKYKTELSGGNVSDLLHIALDKEKMAEILGPENINKLTAKNVSDLLEYASRSAHTSMAEMVEILGRNNIDKLDDRNVYELFLNVVDKEEMARILGKENIDKLSGNTVLGLLRYASNKKKMAEILGSDNINKLSDENVFNLLHDLMDKDEKRQILRKYYTGKDPNIISLINQ